MIFELPDELDRLYVVCNTITWLLNRTKIGSRIQQYPADSMFRYMSPSSFDRMVYAIFPAIPACFRSPTETKRMLIMFNAIFYYTIF